MRCRRRPGLHQTGHGADRIFHESVTVSPSSPRQRRSALPVAGIIVAEIAADRIDDDTTADTDQTAAMALVHLPARQGADIDIVLRAHLRIADQRPVHVIADETDIERTTDATTQPAPSAPATQGATSTVLRAPRP